MFTVRALRDFMFDVFCSTSDHLLDKIDELRNDNGNVNDGNAVGVAVDVYDCFNRLTFEGFTKIAFGINVGEIAKAPAKAEFAYRFDRVFELSGIRAVDPLWKIKRRFQLSYEREFSSHISWINNYIYEIIASRRAFYDQIMGGKSEEERRRLKRQLSFASMTNEANRKAKIRAAVRYRKESIHIAEMHDM